MENVNQEYLLRYTEISSLFYILRKKAITLLNPETWDDNNDKYIISRYKDKCKFRSVLVLCFTNTNETYHHWSVFAKGSSGVCIYFDKEELIKTIAVNKDILHGHIKYMTIDDLKGKKHRRNDLPFIKRIQYQDEREYRIIYGSDKERNYKDITISLNTVKKIKFNPWIKDRLYKHIKSEIYMMPNSENIGISKSRITDSNAWQSIIDNI